MTADVPANNRPDDAAYRLLFDRAEGLAACLLDASGRITAWNDSAERLLGYPAAEAVGRHLGLLVGEPDDAGGRAARALAEAAARGRFLGEATLRRRDGSAVRASVQVAAVHDTDGAPAGFGALVLDLTEQDDLAETIARVGRSFAAELDLRTLVQAVTDAATGLANARFGAFFYNVADDQGGHMTLYTLSGAPPEAFARFPLPRATALFGPTFRAEGVIRLDDVTRDPRYGRNAPHDGMPAGHLPVASYMAVPVVSRSGTVLGGLFFGHPEPGVFTEREERLVVALSAQAAVAIDNARLFDEVRREREKAEAASRAKDEFLAVLSHELRTPLTPVLAGASAMLDEPGLPAEVRSQLELTRRNIELEARLIDDLLDVTRISRGDLRLEPEVIDAHEVIRRSVATCQAEARPDGPGVALDLAAASPRVRADAARLQQVLWNLVGNALKFTPAGGTVVVRTRNEGAGDPAARLVVEVADTGVGIEPELVPLIFDAFRQGEASVARKFGGLGLGLAICRAIVEAHGGTISASSRGPGLGATFRVELATAPATAAAPPPAAPPPPAPARPVKILVVEDDASTLGVLSRLLRSRGCDVRTAGTVADALTTAATEEFDLVISDIGLPDGTGWDLMRQLRQHGEVKGIALTGFGMDDDERRSAEAGFLAHLTKPVNFQKLEATIRQVSES